MRHITGSARTDLCISIQDDGGGIPLESQPHIFDPFYTTKAVGVGTGLGLGIVHRIVDQFGARFVSAPTNMAPSFIGSASAEGVTAETHSIQGRSRTWGRSSLNNFQCLYRTLLMKLNEILLFLCAEVNLETAVIEVDHPRQDLSPSHWRNTGRGDSPRTAA